MTAQSNVFTVIDQMIKDFANDKRSQRQIVGIRKWVANGAIGTLQWPTGVGKTRAATVGITLSRRDIATRKVVVVVPRIALKQQWERGLEALGLHVNTQVIVINSLIKLASIECDLLILDEIHRYAAKTFAKVFNVVKYSYILGLTATLKRTDGKHEILKKFAPIVDSIAMKEAIKQGYVAEFQEYNLGVDMTETEREAYREIAQRYGNCIDKFNSDFGEMAACATGSLTVKLIGNEYREPTCVSYARTLGWRGNTPYKAFQIQSANKFKLRKDREDVWGNAEHPYAPKRMYIWALQGLRYIRLMRMFINAHPAKTAAAEEILRAFPHLKSITFGEVIEPVDYLKQALGNSAVTYHSKMTLKDRRTSLELFEQDESVRAMLTARALDEGADFPEVSLGVSTSRSSSETQYLQRLGRVIRVFIFSDGWVKKAIFVNIFLRDTKDRNWLSKAQKPTYGMQREVGSVRELMAILSQETIAA